MAICIAAVDPRAALFQGKRPKNVQDCCARNFAEFLFDLWSFGSQPAWRYVAIHLSCGPMKMMPCPVGLRRHFIFGWAPDARAVQISPLPSVMIAT
jgi:hypothetical protein